MFNFIFYGRFSSFDFYGSSAGSQHIDLTKDGIYKNILPVIKERGYTQVISIDDKYNDDFTDQFFKMQKRDSVQVCEIKENYPDNGYTFTYYVFIEGMEYNEEFDEQDLKFSIFAFQDFDTAEDTDELPI